VTYRVTDLIGWQKAHAFVLSVYKYTATFPRNEIYGLAAQFRRAAVSIPANMAEGYVKSGKSDKIRYYNISQGSLEECRYFCILAKDLGYGETQELLSLVDEVGKLLNTYIRKIKGTMG
jgi:four helix bundle protein